MSANGSSVYGRAAVLHEFGRPLSIDRFEVPRPPPGGMNVAVQYGGICGTDLHLQRGHLAIPTPLVLGHEGLGWVCELDALCRSDANGAPLAVGETVMWASSISCGECDLCNLNEPTLCRHRRTYGVNRPTTEPPALSGAWADCISLREGTTVVRLERDVDPVAAIALACAGPTIVHAMERRPVRAGETVIVQGSGPVGLAAAALSKLAGASRVIILGGPSARLKLAADARFGDVHLDIFGDSGPAAALQAALEQTPAGAGADLVIECTGVPDAVTQSMHLARRGGACLIVGQYTDGGNAIFNPHQIVYRQLDVIGSWAFSGAHLRRYVALLPALAANFDLRSLVTSFELDEVNEAMQRVKNGSVMKAALNCSTGTRPS